MEKINDFSGLNNLKTELKKQEPIKEGSSRTEAMLTSEVSKKLLTYFFDTYPDVVEKIIKKDPERGKVINALKENFKNNEKLSGENVLFLDTLYVKFLKKIPINEKANKGVVFGKIAKYAGCTSSEIDEAKKILGAFIDPVLEKFFN